MARLILQTILFVALISALYGAPTTPATSTPRNPEVPAIATLDGKPKEEALIRPARNPHHDGTDHDHKDEQPAAIAKLDEHVDHGSSTTPKPREARAAEEDKKKNETPGHSPSEVLKNIKDAVTPTSAKPRTARAAEKDEKHEDSHGHEHEHTASLTKDSQEHKKDATTEQTRPARATEEEKKGAVHDQPIPIPTTLKEEHHTEEKKEETLKQKRETDEKSDEKDDDSKEDESEESPLTYTKQNSDHKEGGEYLALPNKESEYDRHVRQSNDEYHPHTKDIVTRPEHSHLTHHIHEDSSGSSSSEEDKSKSS